MHSRACLLLAVFRKRIVSVVQSASVVMDSKIEQRVAIKFCFKAGKNATETVEMINLAYGDEALTRSNVFRWYGLFRDGRNEVEDNPRSGRPSTSRTDENIENVRQILLKNPRRTDSERFVLQRRNGSTSEKNSTCEA